jgi:hypothetical protein
MEIMMNDNRPIKKIWWPDESYMEVGHGGIEKIVAYPEGGDMGYVTWFAVYRDGNLDQRLNSAHIQSIQYA